MGHPMCQNLLKSAYPLRVFDLKSEQMEPLLAAGAQPATGPLDVIQNCEVMISSLPSAAAWISLMEETIIPHIRPDQVIIDVGTVASFQSRRIGVALQERGD